MQLIQHSFAQGCHPVNEGVHWMTALRKRMLDELHLRNLSKCTERAYLTAVDQYARYFHVSSEKLGSEQVREYLLHLIRDNKAKCNTVVVNRSALSIPL